MTTTTEYDRVLKLSLLRDIYNIVAPNIPPCVSEYVRRRFLSLSPLPLPLVLIIVACPCVSWSLL